MVRLTELENGHHLLEIELGNENEFTYKFRCEYEVVEFTESEPKANGTFVEIRDNK